MATEADTRAAARDHLARLLTRIVADDRVDEAEKEELLAVFRRGVLTKDDVRDVFAHFLKGIRDEILADGVVTEQERERCRSVVRELRIPRAFLSAELIAIVDGAPVPGA